MSEQATSVRSILVPLDGSSLAELALPWALDMAAKNQAEVVLLRVGLPPTVFTAHDLEHLEAFQDQQQVHSMSYLRELEGRLEIPASVPVRLEYAAGNPGQCIVERSEQLGCFMIVMCSSGRDVLSRWLLGSVAERVARHAPCPVLLVREPEPQI